jgi:threonyl-tRNA synthetase
MNCPHHIQIYKAEPRSYRDLPVRLAEFGTVYRFEQTGELSGMTRVRGFTQDDAHLFVTPEQIEAEFSANLDLVLFVLESLGLNDYRVRVGLRDPRSDKYVGKAENWEKAEQDAAVAGEIARHELQRRGGRGGVLRSQDRLRGTRLHRP